TGRQRLDGLGKFAGDKADQGQFGVFLQRLVRRAGRLWLGLAAIGGVSRARENGNLFIRGKVDQRPLGRTKAIDAGDIRVAQEHECQRNGVPVRHKLRGRSSRAPRRAPAEFMPNWYAIPLALVLLGDADVPRVNSLRPPERPLVNFPSDEEIPIFPSAGDSTDGSQAQPKPASTPNQPLQENSKLTLIRFVSGEFAKAVKSLPAG